MDRILRLAVSDEEKLELITFGKQRNEALMLRLLQRNPVELCFWTNLAKSTEKNLAIEWMQFGLANADCSNMEGWIEEAIQADQQGFQFIATVILDRLMRIGFDKRKWNKALSKAQSQKAYHIYSQISKFLRNS